MTIFNLVNSNHYKISFSLGILFLFSYTLKSQTAETLKTSEYFHAPVLGKLYKAPPRGEGSPYLFDTWYKGTIMLNTGDTIRNLLLKLDCFKNELIWMSDGKSIVVVDPNLVNGFFIFPTDGSHRKFQKLNVKIPLIPDTVVKYMEVLTEGYFNLYCQRRNIAYAKQAAGSGKGLFTVNAYDWDYKYFIQERNKPVRAIQISKRSIYKAYPEITPQIKKMLRENHFGSIDNEYQLKEIIRILNTGQW